MEFAQCLNQNKKAFETYHAYAVLSVLFAAFAIVFVV